MSTLASALLLNKPNDVLNLEQGAAERIQTNFDQTFKNFRAVASFVDTFVTTTAGLFALYVPYTGATKDVNLGAYGVSAGYWHGSVVGLAYGGTNADLSATGGTGKILRQSSLGAAITVATLASTELSDTSVIVRTSGSYADPSWLTSLQANKITGSHTLSDLVLSSNVALLNTANSFSAQQSINNAGLQMLFCGYASVTGVASTSNGEIRIGNATNDNLRLQYEGVTNHYAYVDHLYNNAAARLYFRMKASLATPINAMILDAAGNLTILGSLTAGSGAVGIVDATGKIPAISATYFTSLDGSALTGVAAGVATIVNDATTNATMYPTWVTTTTGNLPLKVSSTKLSFNPSTGLLTATGFSGPLTGNVTGNASGSSGSCTGNAATSSAWASARNLAGNSVDGSANVAFANKFIVQGTADAGLSSAQFLGALATGLVLNTTTTGVLSILANGTGWLHNDGAGTLAYSTPTAANVGAEPALGNPAGDGYALVSTALGVRSWTSVSSAPHALLDGTQNNDTLAAGPTRGDLIVANSTPKWARFAVGGAGTFLQGGTDPSWAKIPEISSTYFTSLAGLAARVAMRF